MWTPPFHPAAQREAELCSSVQAALVHTTFPSASTHVPKWMCNTHSYVRVGPPFCDFWADVPYLQYRSDMAWATQRGISVQVPQLCVSPFARAAADCPRSGNAFEFWTSKHCTPCGSDHPRIRRRPASLHLSVAAESHLAACFCSLLFLNCCIWQVVATVYCKHYNTSRALDIYHASLTA